MTPSVLLVHTCNITFLVSLLVPAIRGAQCSQIRLASRKKHFDVAWNLFKRPTPNSVAFVLTCKMQSASFTSVNGVTGGRVHFSNRLPERETHLCFIGKLAISLSSFCWSPKRKGKREGKEKTEEDDSGRWSSSSNKAGLSKERGLTTIPFWCHRTGRCCRHH